MPELDKLVDNINHQIVLEVRLLIADALEYVATTQYQVEPDALYSGVEVAAGLQGYAQAIREGGELNTGAQ